MYKITIPASLVSILEFGEGATLSELRRAGAERLFVAFPHMLGAYWNVKASSFDQPENFRNPEGFSKYLREKGIGHLYGEVLIFRIQIKKQFYYHLISAFLFRYDGREVDAKDLDLLLHYYNDV